MERKKVKWMSTLPSPNSDETLACRYVDDITRQVGSAYSNKLILRDTCKGENGEIVPVEEEQGG